MRTLERVCFTATVIGLIGIYFIERAASDMRIDALNAQIREMTPCDQAVEESRRILEQQLKLRNHTIGDQNESGVVAGYY